MQPFRADRQHAGRDVVILRWFICVRCRHVSLHDWQPDGDPTPPRENG